MTAFATCAYMGCSERIPYDPKKDTERPRYCECHMLKMLGRLPDCYGEGSLYIAVVKHVR